MLTTGYPAPRWRGGSTPCATSAPNSRGRLLAGLDFRWIAWVFFALGALTRPAGAQQLVGQVAILSTSVNNGSLAVNPNLNVIYVSGGSQTAVVNGSNLSITTTVAGTGVMVDTNTNRYWTGTATMNSTGAFTTIQEFIYDGTSSTQVQAPSLPISGGAFIPHGVPPPPPPTSCAILGAADPSHRRMWPAAQCLGNVQVINADTYSTINGSISLGSGMSGIVVNTATDVAYSNNAGGSKRIDSNTFAVTTNAFGVVYGVNPANNRLYALPTQTSLQVVDGSTNPETILSTVSLPFNAVGAIAANSTLNRIYVGDTGGSIHVMDGRTNNFVGSVALGSGVSVLGIAVDSTRNLVYVAANIPTGYELYVIKDASGSVVSRVSDFDGDHKSDMGVWRPSTGTWWIIPSGNPGTRIAQQWGTSGDIPVPGDYDGDGKSDFAIWRPSTGTWWVIPSSNPGAIFSVQWGTSGDIPVPGDYDGDGKTDFAIWRPSTGTWWTVPSSNPTAPIAQQWGSSGDVPVPGDYDGDGKTDYAIWRPSTGTWWIIPSSNPGAAIAQQWGTSGDIPVPGDYDGDGKTDFAIWRPSTGTWWVILTSNPGARISAQWGTSGDIPVPGDYDGDGKTDFAIWRPSTGTWWIVPSSSPGAPIAQPWGTAGDIPAEMPVGMSITTGTGGP